MPVHHEGRHFVIFYTQLKNFSNNEQNSSLYVTTVMPIHHGASRSHQRGEIGPPRPTGCHQHCKPAHGMSVPNLLFEAFFPSLVTCDGHSPGRGTRGPPPLALLVPEGEGGTRAAGVGLGSRSLPCQSFRVDLTLTEIHEDPAKFGDRREKTPGTSPRLSAGGISVPRGHLAMSEDALGCHHWAPKGGCHQHLAARHPATHRADPTAKKHLAPHGDRAEVGDAGSTPGRTLSHWGTRAWTCLSAPWMAQLLSPVPRGEPLRVP